MKQTPHCDPKVLHGPKANCVYCNQHPDQQELRITWGINFTGEYDTDKLICPSEIARPLEVINKWGGNVPATPAHIAKSKMIWDKALSGLKPKGK